jgi:hypothetical protein
VIAIFTEPNTRTTLGKVCCAYGGRAIWDLILDTIDAGLLTTNHAAIRVANLRLLFPAAPTTGYVQRFDLTKAADRKIIRDVILPAAAANREAVSANPADLERIVARHGQPDPVVLKAARQEAALKRATDAGQQKIVAFGEVMWPHEQGLYDYDQIRCAIWLLQDFEILFKAPANQSPGSRADYIKVSMIWLNQYIARMKTTVPAEQHADKMLRVLAMLHKLADLMQRNPTGECVFPYSPKVEGEW